MARKVDSIKHLSDETNNNYVSHRLNLALL